MALRDMALSKRDHFIVDPRKLRVDDDYNLRDLTTPAAIQSLRELAASIRESGVRVPLKIRLDQANDEAVIVQGHRRHRAIMMLIEEGVPFEGVPCFVEEKENRNDADRTIDLFLSNDGEPLKELEKAEGIKRLLSYGWKEVQIAAKLGKSPGYVSHLLGVSNLPEPAKEMVREGEVSASLAAKTIKAEGAAEGVETLREAVADSRAENEAEAPLAPKQARATPKRVEKVAERKKGATTTAAQREPKPRRSAQNMSSLYDALFTHLDRFFGKIARGYYDDDPTLLQQEGHEMHQTIKQTRAGFKEMEAEAAE